MSLRKSVSGSTKATVGGPKASADGFASPVLEHTYRGHRNAVSAAAFHPSLQQLASGSHDGNVMVWHTKPTMRALRFVGHRGPIHDVAFSEQGGLVASASSDTTVRLWIPSVRGESSIIKAHSGTVRGVRFSADGSQLITCSDDKSVKLWSVATQRFTASFGGHQNWVRCAQMARDGRLCASGGDDRVLHLWDPATRKTVQSFYEHIDAVTCVAFHPDGHCVAAGSADRTVNLWDLRMNKLLQHYDAHTDTVTAIDFDVTGSWLVSASLDATAKLWDLREGFQYCTVSAHEGPVLGARFSPCARNFATTGQDGLVMVWTANLPGVADVAGPTPRQSYASDRSKLPGTGLTSPAAPHATTPRNGGLSRPTSAATTSSKAATASAPLPRHQPQHSSTIRTPAVQQPVPDDVVIETSVPVERVARQVDIVAQSQSLLERRLQDRETAAEASRSAAERREEALSGTVTQLRSQLESVLAESSAQRDEIAVLRDALVAQQEMMKTISLQQQHLIEHFSAAAQRQGKE